MSNNGDVQTTESVPLVFWWHQNQVFNLEKIEILLLDPTQKFL
jgi:hypothetical protein